jgi:two-component system OmpR family response regulator
MSQVLIVDDAEDMCSLLSYILKHIGFEADCVGTLSDASVAISSKVYPLVLLDNHLPDGFGIDFIECIKKDSPTSKIVMITAFDSNEVKEKALDKGANIIIGKPFTKQTIYQAIDALNITNVSNQ